MSQTRHKQRTIAVCLEWLYNEIAFILQCKSLILKCLYLRNYMPLVIISISKYRYKQRYNIGINISYLKLHSYNIYQMKYMSKLYQYISKWKKFARCNLF